MKIPYEPKKDFRKFFEKPENIHYFCPPYFNPSRTNQSDTAKDGRVNPVGLSLYTLVYISLPNFAFRCGDGSIVLAEVNGKNYR